MDVNSGNPPVRNSSRLSRSLERSRLRLLLLGSLGGITIGEAFLVGRVGVFGRV